MTRKKHFLSICMPLAMVFIVSCNGFLPLAGGGTEDVNTKTIVGNAAVASGQSADQTIVRLLPRGYNPVSGLPLPHTMTDTADAKGNYVFKISDTGVFNIQAVNTASGERLLVRDIPVFTDSTIVPYDTLRMPGTINIMLPDDADIDNGYVYIPGTTFHTFLTGVEGSIITLYKAPSNVLFPLNYGAPTPGPVQRTLMENVRVSSGGNITTLYSSWKHFRKAGINTTTSGASIQNDVYGFPLLVRLDKSNFAFSEADAQGDDIVFTKSDHSELPFEIERWDPVNGRAEIWVRVDTVFGNNATQSIFMYWGASTGSATQSLSNSTAVFDSAHGFQGVWHLADNDLNSRVLDATGKNNGVMKSGAGAINTSSTCIDGIDGDAVWFRGRTIKHWIDLGADKAFINNKSEVSISVWMNADVDTFASKELICFSKSGELNSGNPESRAKIALTNNKIIFSVMTTDSGERLMLTSTKSFVPKQWYHITGVMKVPRDSIYLYVNGELWGSASAPFKATATPSTNSTGSAIGANDLGNDDYFYGKLDEARIEGTARSADWIKLTYWNQSQKSLLTGFVP